MDKCPKNVAEALGGVEEELSEQGKRILTSFAQTGAKELIYSDYGEQGFCLQTDRGPIIEGVTEPRFLADDLRVLTKLGLLACGTFGESSIYNLTRRGLQASQNILKENLGKRTKGDVDRKTLTA